MDLTFLNFSEYFWGIPALVLGVCSLAAIDHLPAKWLCDYDETPGPRHLAPRTSFFPWWMGAGGFFGFYTICFIALHTPSFWQIFCLLAVLTILMQIAVIDALYLIIPDQHIAALFISGILIRLPGLLFFNDVLINGVLGSLNMFFPFLAGSFVCAGLPLIVSFLCFKLSGREAIGFGDIKLFAGIGFILGPYGGLTVMAASFFFSGLIFSVRILKKEIGPKEEQPFGPYAALCLAAYLLLNST